MKPAARRWTSTTAHVGGNALLFVALAMALSAVVELVDGDNNQTYGNADFGTKFALPGNIQRPKKLRIYLNQSPTTSTTVDSIPTSAAPPLMISGMRPANCAAT